MKLKLFHKISIILISLATIPVMIVGWQTATLNQEHLETNILELHTNLANSLSNRIDLHLNSLAGKVRIVVDSIKFQGFISEDPLKNLIRTNPEFIAVSYVNFLGKEMVKASRESENKMEDFSNNPLFVSYRMQEKSSFIEPKYAFHFDGEAPELEMFLPFNSEKFNLGAFRVLVSLADLWKDISAEGAGVQSGGRESFVVDENGMVIFHSDIQKVIQKESLKDHPIVFEALEKKSIGSKEFKDEKGSSFVGAYSRVKLTGWVSVIQQPKRSAYVAVYETRKRAVGIVILSILIASMIAFFLARNISKPIFALIAGAMQVSQRNFHAHVQVNTEDEMSDLAKTFNEMVRELSRYDELQVDKIIEEKTKTEAVIFSIADGIILVNHEGIIQIANDNAVRIFSGKESGAENWVGKNLFDLVQDVEAGKTLKQLIDDPESRMTKEILINPGAYQQYYQLTSGVVHAQKTGKRIGIVTAVHDVTLERQMDELQDTFFHAITHDLRNPMTSILGFIKFLIDGSGGPVTETQVKMLETMQRAGNRLLSMINDILDVAKAEAGKLEVELTPSNVPLILEEVVKLYNPLAEKKAIRLQAVVPQTLQEKGLVVSLDPNQIERTVSNLVANAIRFTPNEGKITVELEDFEDRVQIFVKDTGPGIPEMYQEKIFDKFQQLRGMKHGGSGLGLTICRYFIEMHGGKIWVESEVGKGSKFIFRIPKKSEQSPKT